MATRRPKKKKSSAPIWAWTGVSAGVLALICVLLYFTTQPGPPDRATGASAEANLVKQTLPDDLPTLAEPPSGDSSIDELFSKVAEVQRLMNAGGYEDEKKAAAAGVVQTLKAAASSEMPHGLLDERIPEKRFDAPQVKKDLQALGKAVSTYIDQQLAAFAFDPAREAAFAQVLLGKQIFESNTRLKARQSGLSVMRSGLNHLRDIERAAYDDGAIDQDELKQRNTKIMAWNDAVKNIEDVWNAKLESIETVASKRDRPNTADLKKIAMEDKDPTFRIFAARRMGYARYERGDPGNQAFLAETIELLLNGEDKAVAAAAEDGKAVKRDEYYELK